MAKNMMEFASQLGDWEKRWICYALDISSFNKDELSNLLISRDRLREFLMNWDKNYGSLIGHGCWKNSYDKLMKLTDPVKS